MMSVAAYLLEYTLNVVCGGNKSECARKLDIRRQDLNRMQKRFADGANSARIIESILILFWKEGRSLDQALREYVSDPPGRSEDQFPLEEIQELHQEMNLEWQRAGAQMRLVKCAETFMIQLEHSFCSAECRQMRDCQTECPCRKFAEFVSWIRMEFDRSFPPQQ